MTSQAKCPKCGMVQMAHAFCKACGTALGAPALHAPQMRPTPEKGKGDPDMLRQLPIHKQRIVILSAAAAGMLGTFLPWVHVPILGSVNGTGGDGWITLLLFLPAAILGLRGNKQQPLVARIRLGAVIPAALASLIGLWKIIEFKTGISQAAAGNPFTRI